MWAGGKDTCEGWMVGVVVRPLPAHDTTTTPPPSSPSAPLSSSRSPSSLSFFYYHHHRYQYVHPLDDHDHEKFTNHAERELIYICIQKINQFCDDHSSINSFLTLDSGNGNVYTLAYEEKTIRK